MPPSPQDGLSSLGRAREQIYRSDSPSAGAVEPLTPRAPSGIPRRWGVVSAFGAPRHVRLASRFFAGALIFFLLALIVAGLLFFTGTNSVSTGNIDLSLQGPTTIAGGDTLPLSITITNKNPVTITDARIEVDFPDGTRSADDLTSAYPRYIENIGTLAPGATVERSVKAVLFGTQDAHIQIPVSLSYSTGGSNAVFVKKNNYAVTISTAPLSLAVSTVSEVVSGKSFPITVTVRSNATAPIEGVVLGAQYPNSFALTSSSLTPIGTNFQIGTLAPGDTKTIQLAGTLNGQNNDQRVFHFTIGTAKGANDPALAVSYMTQDAAVTISAPFLSTAVTVNGSSTETPAVAPGSSLSVSVAWTNTLSVPVQNATIEVALSGSGLDVNNVNVPSGFYRSGDHTIIFNRDTNPSLALLAPNASGSASFTLNALKGITARNASIILTLSIAGTRAGQSGVPEQVSASAAKVVKVASAVMLSSSALHSSGAFSNVGPVPPKVDLPTTYTIVWNITNTGNDLADTSVSAALPSYVTFTGATKPADSSLTYDNSSRMMLWKAGDIPSGSSRQAAFQVAFTPSASQKGGVPTLTLAPTFSGFDRFVQTKITVQGSPATTETKGDPGYVAANAIVQ